MTSTLSPTLARSRETFLPALRAAVARMDPASAAMSSYHLGWTDADGRPLEGSGGKAIRPALAMLSAQAAGADAQAGVPGAVAVELVHNFSLLHDDVMDGDTERRHRPTVWALWGVPSAILTGDAMLTVAQEALLDSGSPNTVAALRLLAEATRELIHGQVDDLAFETRDRVDLRTCQQMAARKTGSLLAVSAAIGAVLAGAPDELVRGLYGYGHSVGAAFQLVDDLLGIWGDPSVTGKPVLSDLRSRKRSLPITFVLERYGDSEFADWFGRPAEFDDDRSLHRAADLIEAAGGRQWATDEAGREIEKARRYLDRYPIPEAVAEELIGLARFVVDRDF